MHKPRIGITLGDVNGIGPEVVLKALSDNRMLSLVTPVVYGSTRVLSHYKKLLGIEELNYSQARGTGQYNHKAINVVNCWEESLEINPGKASREAGTAAVTALRQACQELKDGHLDALVTGPIDKHTVHGEGFPYRGHTEFLTQFFDARQSLMLLVSDTLRIGLVTEHLPLNQVTAMITKDRLEAKINLMEMSLKKDFGITKPKIALLALNPHAGDGGLIGQEDDAVIKPVVNDYRNKGKLVFGPFPADGFFGSGQFRKYDGILAMYHDQGLIPFKALAFEDGVNFTAGLPVVRTSPDHGTAFAIAGKNQANESSVRQAIYDAAAIFKQRQQPSIEK